MKNITLFIVMLLLFACSSTQTIIDPVSKKEVKVFKNEEFSFFYPKNWIEFGTKLDFLDIPVKISPKKTIKIINKPRINLVFEQGKTAKNISRDNNYLNQRISFNNLTIYKTKVGNTSMKRFIEILKKSDEALKYKFVQHKNSYSKKRGNYYIQFRTIRTVKDSKTNIIPMNLTNHFIKNDSIIYKISFMFEIEKEKEYIDDVAFILNSFEFSDGTSLK